MPFYRWFLTPLAPLYGFAVKARNWIFDNNPHRAERAAVPVLSIGNLSVGGTGKTPLTMHLAQALNGIGWPNMVISRGYGGRRKIDPMDVNPDSNPSQAGDEPVMIARRLGANRVVVGRRRAAAALRAVSSAPSSKLLILDDGFQHRAIHRDIDLLLLDGVRTWGNGKLLPLGNLREPMASARRAHALVVTRGGLSKKNEIEAWWSTYGSAGPIFYVNFRISALRNASTGERVKPRAKLSALYAFCALGHPKAFFADLLVAGLSWVDAQSFKDHQSLSPGQLAKIAARASDAGAECLVCTEKDAVKFTQAHISACPMPIWIAEQDVVGAEKLVGWIDGRLRALNDGKAQH
jgi:tetraacyldisaccharide 4'-kinase